jgi:Putative prokaryotic signal transducing protein
VKSTYTIDSVAIKAIYRPADELMANAVRDLFEANGIPAMIRSFQIPAYDGLARIMRPVWGEVLVDEEDMAKAKELLDAFLSTDAGEAGKQE